MKEAVQRFAYGQHEVTLETGRIARQASGAVLAAMGDTRVLATVVASQRASDEFPVGFSSGKVDRQKKPS